jgi:periplasmic protein TonB
LESDVFLNRTPGWQPALDSLRTARRNSGWWIAGSVLAHALFLLAWCWPAEPGFIKPRWLARGEGGAATPSSTVLYLPQDFQLANHPLVSLPSVLVPKQNSRRKLKKRTNLLDIDKTSSPAEAGSAAGTSFDGASEGDEIKPGFAVRFNAPRVSRSELPGGLQGDVIVELTIDTQGNVVDERLLQGLGHGIDEMVIATLRDWHFRPATRNGIAIPFEYDAHFHFPS